MSFSFIPWRARTKLTSSQKAIVKPIPKWTSSKAQKVTMHHIHGLRTWMCDHFFINPSGDVVQDTTQQQTYVILAFMHVNSRLFNAFIVPDKSMKTFYTQILYYTYPAGSEAPQWIRDERKSLMDTLITDYAFESMRGWLKGQGIQLLTKNIKRTQNHSWLAPIDRLARTLRDMIFNAKRTQPSFQLTPETLTTLCNIYNNTPHNTLSRLMGFPVTPLQVFTILPLQEEIIKRLYLENYNTQQSAEYKSLKIGSIVYVHQPHQFLKKRRFNVEEDPYKVISLTPLILQNVRTGVHKKDVSRKDIVISNN